MRRHLDGHFTVGEMPAGLDLAAVNRQVTAISQALFDVCDDAFAAGAHVGTILNAVQTVLVNLGLDAFGEAAMQQALAAMAANLPEFARQRTAMRQPGGRA